jgi:hypothetical protein
MARDPNPEEPDPQSLIRTQPLTLRALVRKDLTKEDTNSPLRMIDIPETDLQETTRTVLKREELDP